MYLKILVPTDGSKLSDKAVKEAVKLAKLAGSEIVLVHVRAPYDVLPSAEMGPTSGSERRRLAELAKADAEKVLNAAGRLAKAESVSVNKRYISSTSAFEAIIKTANKEKCDLIVMASHGRRGLAGMIIGSETQKVLTHTKLPVLVVR